MKYTGLARKISAAAMAVLLSAGALSGGSMYSITADYEDEISSLEQRQAELAEERRMLEDKKCLFRNRKWQTSMSR